MQRNQLPAARRLKREVFSCRGQREAGTCFFTVKRSSSLLLTLCVIMPLIGKY